MTASRRKALGSWYTPPALATALAERTLRGVPAGATVVDLACGDGALLAAAAQLGDFRLVGFDIDPEAVAAARLRLPAALIHHRDGLTADVRADVVLGNPPFLFGARRPNVDASRFLLARGQWDAAWLFLEAALSSLEPGGRFGFVLPDSVLARHETVAVRRFVRERTSEIWLRHDPPSFAGAHVATVLLSGVRGDGGGCRLEMLGELVPLEHDACWPPPPPVPAHWDRLADLASISRGEEVGKRSLVPLAGAGSWGAGDEPRPVVTGAGITPLRQPQPTHWLPTARVRKSAALYEAPKVVVAKTGRTLRAGVDTLGLTTLQSVYNVHAREPGLTAARFLCGVLVCDEVQRRFVLPFTSGKKVFPQITKRLLLGIRLPPRTPEVVGAVTESVATADLARLLAVTSAWYRDDEG